jgi:GAF domain-containing protein
VIAALLAAPVAVLVTDTRAGGFPLAAGFAVGYCILAIAAVPLWRTAYRTTLLVSALLIFAASELLASGVSGLGPILLIGAAVIAAVLTSARAGIAVTAVGFALFSVAAWMQTSGRFVALDAAATLGGLHDWVLTGGGIAAFSVAAMLGLRRWETSSTETQRIADAAVRSLALEHDRQGEVLADQARQFIRVNEMSRAFGAATDPEVLLSHATRAIAEEFNCYACAILLLDQTGAWAENQASAGEAAAAIGQAERRIDLLGGSPVAAAIREKRASRVSATDAGAPFADDLLLPRTRSRLAVPLVVSDRTLGAVDLHSYQDAAFPRQRVEMIEDLALDLAMAIEHARALRATQQDLNELRAAQKQYVLGAWQDFSNPRTLDYSLGEPDAQNPAPRVDFPLTLRDQIIGQISLASEQEWTPEQRGMVEAIATQAALALENARLMEESQSLAAQERLAADLTARIWAASSAAEILETTARELGRALGTAETTIEVGAD